MARRILGQCSQADFKSIEHLVSIAEKPEMLDFSTVSSKQRYALHFLILVQRKKIPYKLLRVIKEVLFWGEGEKVIGVEIKFLRVQKNMDDIDKFNHLWRFGG